MRCQIHHEAGSSRSLCTQLVDKDPGDVLEKSCRAFKALDGPVSKSAGMGYEDGHPDKVLIESC